MAERVNKKSVQNFVLGKYNMMLEFNGFDNFHPTLDKAVKYAQGLPNYISWYVYADANDRLKNGAGNIVVDTFTIVGDAERCDTSYQYLHHNIFDNWRYYEIYAERRSELGVPSCLSEEVDVNVYEHDYRLSENERFSLRNREILIEGKEAKLIEQLRLMLYDQLDEESYEEAKEWFYGLNDVMRVRFLTLYQMNATRADIDTWNYTREVLEENRYRLWDNTFPLYPCGDDERAMQDWKDFGRELVDDYYDDKLKEFAFLYSKYFDYVAFAKNYVKETGRCVRPLNYLSYNEPTARWRKESYAIELLD